MIEAGKVSGSASRRDCSSLSEKVGEGRRLRFRMGRSENWVREREVVAVGGSGRAKSGMLYKLRGKSWLRLWEECSEFRDKARVQPWKGGLCMMTFLTNSFEAVAVVEYQRVCQYFLKHNVKSPHAQVC